MNATVSDVFDVRYGHSLELNALELSNEKDGIAFVSRQTRHNGIAAYVAAIDGVEPAPAGEITCALSGNGVLTTCLQERPFYTAFHVAILRPKIALTKQQTLFYCLCIQRNRYRFSYGRQANKTLSSLLVPSVKQIPNWVNATNLDQLEGANKAVSNVPTPRLMPAHWGWFKVGLLFDIKKGRRLTKQAMKDGSTPFIGAIDSNNGHRQYISAPADHAPNTITVNYNGGVAEAFYQQEPYFASDDVNVLYPKFDLNPYVAMFLCTIIRQEKYRYNYGRKWHLERMNETEIRLPVTPKNEPDWNFMEGYIKSLPYSVSTKRQE